jgi:hypothetical protein
VKIVKNERDPPLFTGKLLIEFHGETSISPYNFLAGDITIYQNDTWGRRGCMIV